MNRPRAALFDLDGTLAVHKHRSPYDWRRADRDLLNEPVAPVLKALHRDGVTIVYISGRPEAARSITHAWIADHVGVEGPLHLRADGDNRQDAVVKQELYEQRIERLHEVIAVFDDRDKVVTMWRERFGLTCFQVAPGDF